MYYGRQAIGEENRENPQALKLAPYILYGFCLTPQCARATIPGILLLRADSALLQRERPLGGSTCNTCRVGPCNASIRDVPPAGTGCALTFPVPTLVWNSALRVAARCKRCLRLSVRASAWGHARSPRVLHFGLVRAEESRTALSFREADRTVPLSTQPVW